jgi:hypothetical protein
MITEIIIFVYNDFQRRADWPDSEIKKIKSAVKCNRNTVEAGIMIQCIKKASEYEISEHVLHKEGMII